VVTETDQAFSIFWLLGGDHRQDWPLAAFLPLAFSVSARYQRIDNSLPDDYLEEEDQAKSCLKRTLAIEHDDTVMYSSRGCHGIGF
jgi:hypothetical protein